MNSGEASSINAKYMCQIPFPESVLSHHHEEGKRKLQTQGSV
jgi:hypothetical protein